MQFKSLTYTSLAALDLTDEQLRAIHDDAQSLNGIDGISGLLLFNGVHFLQWIEGPPEAVDDLVGRLRCDPRHSAIEVRDERIADERVFGGWSMKLMRVRSSYLLAHEDIVPQLPAKLPEHVRERILGMVEKISEDVEL
ncbi:BLUF domain-containing protein [Sphingomonas glaciei]|uniref:BLUF domain-containing protein n=1 Tax=Sphingomonas glaciei TaxID=2938948 RepID=A0ABY5MWV2_9SPHN|nr:BLUF domain-containing protein [Sphingomonas glaciei]UUR08938.1 BLUF domain-containing protein [Sphingomonas glaciei]